MAKLTTAQRKSMPQSKYALPGKRFPLPDKGHAVAAERLVGRSLKAGSITPGQAATVKAKAKKKLGKKISLVNQLAGS